MEFGKWSYVLLVVLVPLVSSNSMYPCEDNKLLCLLSKILNKGDKNIDIQPMIGVVMQYISMPPMCEEQYAMTSYRSFVEQAGAGAVPVFVDQPDSYYEQLIPRLNGVLFPGGDLDNIITSPFANVTRNIFNMAKKMNDAGTHFPIWGTCQGFEEMTALPLSPPRNLLINCSGTHGLLLPLDYTSAARTSKLFRGLSNVLRKTLGTEKLTPNFHDICLSTKTFDATDQLNQFYDVLSTNVDSKGLEFVSTFEAKEYPFYGVQWHPEKINYQYVTGLNTDPSLNSILLAQYFGNFLVQEARKNNNSFHSVEEAGRFLFNNYRSTFGISFGSSYHEIYCLKKSDAPPFDKQ